MALVKCIASFQVNYLILWLPSYSWEVPSEVTAPESDQTTAESQKLVCYVLQNHSRSNALVVDAETRRLKLPAALDPMQLGNHKEKASLLFCSIMMKTTC